MFYYNRQGAAISFEKFVELYAKGPEYRQVKETMLPNGIWVSTVFLGLDHNMGRGGPPLIFETMAFDSEKNLNSLACVQSSREREARIAHIQMCARYLGENHG